MLNAKETNQMPLYMLRPLCECVCEREREREGGGGVKKLQMIIGVRTLAGCTR